MVERIKTAWVRDCAKDEWERLQADMKQIIRYSHMEELTQELVDTFIK